MSQNNRWFIGSFIYLGGSGRDRAQRKITYTARVEEGFAGAGPESSNTDSIVEKE